MPLIFMCFLAPYTRAASHTQAAPSMPTVPTHPSDFPHMLAPFSHTFPRLPHTVTKLQKPSSNFNETSVPAQQIPNQLAQQIPRTCVSSLHRSPTNQPANSPTLGYTCTAMAASYASQPAETSGRSTQTYASNQLTQIPPSNDWGAWTTTLRRRCDVDDRGASTCMYDRAIGPKGPMIVGPEGPTAGHCVPAWPT